MTIISYLWKFYDFMMDGWIKLKIFGIKLALFLEIQQMEKMATKKKLIIKNKMFNVLLLVMVEFVMVEFNVIRASILEG